MLAFLIAWLPATALMIVLLLNFGTNWRGVGHAIVPAATTTLTGIQRSDRLVAAASKNPP